VRPASRELVLWQKPWWVTVLQRRSAAELLSLYKIHDPLRFARGALQDELRSRGATLPPEKFEDASSLLVEVLCRQVKRYDPSRHTSCSTYTYSILRRRYTDYLRGDRGDSRYGNDGRVQSVADPELLNGAGGLDDPQTFAALVEELDHDKLSQRARGALRELARLVVEEGLSVTEAADQFGKSRREATRDFERLRAELAA
jgi:RNA polymerase sigma factor (sigma-70 family)